MRTENEKKYGKENWNKMSSKGEEKCTGNEARHLQKKKGGT